jgi:hypothetical protein
MSPTDQTHTHRLSSEMMRITMVTACSRLQAHLDLHFGVGPGLHLLAVPHGVSD